MLINISKLTWDTFMPMVATTRKLELSFFEYVPDIAAARLP